MSLPFISGITRGTSGSIRNTDELSITIAPAARAIDRKSTRLNSSHTVIYTLSLHDALPILLNVLAIYFRNHERNIGFHPEHGRIIDHNRASRARDRSEEHTSELQSHSDLHSFPTRRSSDLAECPCHLFPESREEHRVPSGTRTNYRSQSRQPRAR